MFVKWRKILFDRTFHHKDAKFPNSLIDWFSKVTQLLRGNGVPGTGEGKVVPHRETECRGYQNGQKNCFKRAKIDFFPSPSFEL